MSLVVATQITAVATAILALFAIVTALFAFLAFRKQSAEVAILGKQLEDQQALTRQQADLLKVQSGQLALQSRQFDEQRKLNEKQAEVLALQAKDLEESLAERQRDREQRRQAQAARVFISQDLRPPDSREAYLVALTKSGQEPQPSVAATVHNKSDQPIYDAELMWRRGSSPWGEPNPEPLPVIMPDSEVRTSREFPADTNFDVSGAIVRFRDAAGVRWVRRPDGALSEMTT
jgi:hypothetical protein